MLTAAASSLRTPAIGQPAANTDAAGTAPFRGGWSGERLRQGYCAPRRKLRIGTERPTPIDDRDPLLLRLDDKPLDDAASRKRDHITRIERQHLLVAAEPGALAEPPIQRKCDLRHLALLGP